MPTYQEQKMSQSSIDEEISPTELAYYSHRLQARMFDALVTAFADEVNAERISRATLAKRINASPSQITRCNSSERSSGRILGGRNVLGLGVTEAPNLVALDALGGDIANHLIMVSATSCAGIGQKLDDRVERNIDHAAD